MLHINDYLDTEKLVSHIHDGLVHVKNHPKLPLVLYTYSRKCVYDDIWDDVTTKTRGLIVDHKGVVVARPFEKFFNLNTSSRPETHLLNLPDPAHKPMIQEKLDGSLGIFYTYENDWGIATKGSFESDHAKWAMRELVAGNLTNLTRTWSLDSGGYTVLFEIICEHIQHHVVHYGFPRLTVLAAVERDTGIEMPRHQLEMWRSGTNLDLVKTHSIGVIDAIGADRENAEGYVLTWNYTDRPPLKIKVKHPTFLRHQKILHSATPKNIYELLKDGDRNQLREWMEVVPWSMKTYISDIQVDLETEYSFVFGRVHSIVQEALQTCTTRKEFAAYLLKPENKKYSSICFLILDQNPKYQKQIWKLVWENIGASLNKRAESYQDDDLLEAA